MTAPHDHVPLRDHWWPRPGWRPGRIALTWHLVFPHSIPLARHVAAYQRAFDGLPGVDPVPAAWLHLTVQAIGWADEIPAATVVATHPRSAKSAKVVACRRSRAPGSQRGMGPA